VNYSILILRRAQKELAGISKQDFQRIVDSINALASDPRPANCKKLVARDGWRIRSGNYRVIYEIDDEARVVTVVHIGNRRDVYS
jgi:mRNA interferase RelE/StbE